jgi:hypothetical protein
MFLIPRNLKGGDPERDLDIFMHHDTTSHTLLELLNIAGFSINISAGPSSCYQDVQYWHEIHINNIPANNAYI